MKANVDKYPKLKELPLGAMTVHDYAIFKGISTAYIYKQIKEGKAAFKIVLFHGINFIIP